MILCAVCIAAQTSTNQRVTLEIDKHQESGMNSTSRAEQLGGKP